MRAARVHRARLHGLHRRAQVRCERQCRLPSSASSACTPPAPTCARPWEVPLVRQKLRGRDAALRACAAIRIRGKALRHILETLPRDELFQSSEDELFAHRHRHPAAAGARAHAAVRASRPLRPLLLVPRVHPARPLQRRSPRPHRGRCSSARCTASSVDSSVQMGESPLAQLHLVVRPEARRRAALRRRPSWKPRSRQIVRNWHDELRDTLVQRHGEEKGIKLANRYGEGAAGRLHRGSQRRTWPPRTSNRLPA